MASYTTLRSALNPAVTGPNTDALLNAFGTGDDLNATNVQNMFSNMFIQTATGQFLDYLAANSGVIRPPNIGISDSTFRQIVAEIVGIKNTTNSILNLLNIYYTQYQVQAYNETGTTEPYNLANNETLTVQIDNGISYVITFLASAFQSIGAAQAIEVANFLTQTFYQLQINAIATAYYDITAAANRVRILTQTIGPRGAVKVTGGQANNILQFATLIPTTQTTGTQFSVTNPTGITWRYTWTGGTNPTLDLVSFRNVANIYGQNFNANNQGSFSITNVVSGPVNNAYFEVANLAGVQQASVTLQNSSDILFFNAIDKTVLTNPSYATYFEPITGEGILTIPASTAIVTRTPTTAGAYEADNKYTMLHGAQTFTVNETVIGTTSKASGMAITVSSGLTVLGDVYGAFVVGETLLGESSNISSTLTSFSKIIDNTVLGSYLVDFKSFVYSSIGSTLQTPITINSNSITIKVNSTSGWPTTGYLIIDLGLSTEEKPIPYINVLNSNEVLINPKYVFQFNHAINANVMLLNGIAPYTVTGDGSDRGAYMTDVANARQSLINNIGIIKSAGVPMQINIKYPSDIGLGNAGTNYSDIIKVYGPDGIDDSVNLLAALNDEVLI